MVKHDTRESMFGLYLTQRNDIVCFERLAVGSETACLVDTKAICRTAILVGAQGIILVHNHPSGDPDPSSDDIAMTRKVSAACKLFSVTLFDHVVVASQGYASMREKGMMTDGTDSVEG